MITNRYLTHFSSIIFIHALVLMGTWGLSESELVRAKIGDGVMKLQIASQQINNPPVIERPRAIPVNPSRPKTLPVVQPETKAQPETQVVEGKGSEFGTSEKGKTDILSVYKAELRAMIDKNKYYPPMSRRLGQQGTVVVAFTLLEDGNIINVKIDSPSRYERLNDSALDAVKKVRRFKPIPKEIGEPRMDIKVPVKFFTI